MWGSTNVTPLDYHSIVAEQVHLARQRVKGILKPLENVTPEEAEIILGTYRVAIEPNFIPWIMRAYQTAQSATAKHVLLTNIHDEITQDHPKMLREFTESAGVRISQVHYERAAQPVNDMWKLYAQENGLRAMAVAATLENTSILFIPYLRDLAHKRGGQDFTYTDFHGEADIAHAQDLYQGLVEEMNFNYNPKNLVTAVAATASFLERILSV
jgi:hypothetical protein